MQVIVPKATRSFVASVTSMLIASACMTPDVAIDPDTQNDLNNHQARVLAPVPINRSSRVAPETPATLEPYLSAHARKLVQFRQDHRQLLSDVITDARADQLLTSNSQSRADRCLTTRRLAQKYGGRFSEIAKQMDVDIAPQFLDALALTSPVCASDNTMSLFANRSMLAGRLASASASLSVDEIDDSVEVLLNDSLTEAGYDRVAAIDLSGATSMSAVDATLNSISTHGLGSIDYAIFVGGKEQLRIEYANVEATDWENLPEPYMIFDPIFGWRLPTWNEVWQSVGFSCVQGVGMNRSSIRSAAFAGARAGFISGMGGGPGAAVLSGALAGAAAAGGAVAVACAGGAVYGTILLVGMIHIQ